MVKAKTRVAPRNKGSKRCKAVAKPARKIAVRQAAPKQARAKVRRAGGTKSKKKRPVNTVERKTSRRVTAAAEAAAEILARANETTVVETNDRPTAGAVVVT